MAKLQAGVLDPLAQRVLDREMERRITNAAHAARAVRSLPTEPLVPEAMPEPNLRWVALLTSNVADVQSPPRVLPARAPAAPPPAVEVEEESISWDRRAGRLAEAELRDRCEHHHGRSVSPGRPVSPGRLASVARPPPLKDTSFSPRGHVRKRGAHPLANSRGSGGRTGVRQSDRWGRDVTITCTPEKKIAWDDAFARWGSNLHQLAAAGLTSQVADSLEQSSIAEVNARNAQQQTALHVAALNGHSEVCRVLLESPRFGQADAVDREGRTALHIAAANGHTGCVETIAFHPEFEPVLHRDSRGWTALEAATTHWNRREVQSVLLEHPSFRPASEDDDTLLEHYQARTRGRALAKQGVHTRSRPPSSAGSGAGADADGDEGAASEVVEDADDGSGPPPEDVDATARAKLMAAGSDVEAATHLASAVAVNGADVDGATLLHIAARRDLAGGCRALLRRASFVRAGDNDAAGLTALHRAAMLGHEGVCKALLSEDRFHDVNGLTESSCSALHCAATSGHTAVCALLLGSPSFTATNVQDGCGRTALCCAAAAGNFEVCKFMLHCQAVDIDLRDHDGWTPLHHAARGGSAKVCRLLLDNHRFAIDTAKKLAKGGLTALHVAALHGRAEACDAIALHPEFGLADARDDQGRTAYQIADGTTCSALYLRLSAYEEDGDGEPKPALNVESGIARPLFSAEAFFQAIEASREGTALMMLTTPGFVWASARDWQGLTALHCAASKGFASLCRALLGHVDFTEANDRFGAYGWTALHFGAAHGHAEVAKTLLDHGRFGEADRQDQDGWTALHCAAANGHADVCEVLLSHSRFRAARAKTKEGEEAVDIANGDALEFLMHGRRSAHASVPPEVPDSLREISVPPKAEPMLGEDLGRHDKQLRDALDAMMENCQLLKAQSEIRALADPDEEEQEDMEEDCYERYEGEESDDEDDYVQDTKIEVMESDQSAPVFGHTRDDQGI